MGNLFGTDGVRGVANEGLTAALAFRLGQAGAFALNRQGARPRIVIGKDTRISGDMLEAALMAGILSVGGDCIRAGVIPTPGLAYLARTMGCSAGVMISASHNPVPDNGIKFFAGDGFKLPDAIEDEIEGLVLDEQFTFPRPVGDGIGRVAVAGDCVERYLAFLKEQASGLDLTGMKLVIDCANGAASHIAPQLLTDLGAMVHIIYGEPNGININAKCGSTHTGPLQRVVPDLEADLGLAFDGDADRLIAVDEQGMMVDGDQIMVACSLARQQKGTLPGNRVVVSVMSNLGLWEAFRSAGIEVLETKVGDRYILEEMRKSRSVLGGEQSGHIIFLDRTTTGDGLLTAVELLKVVRESGQPLSSLAGQMTRFPQVLINIKVQDRKALNGHPVISEAVRLAEQKLEGRGRILVRPSGTEPLVRVMGEGPREDELMDVVSALSDVVRAELG
jgi:phosphoglucosamine mutase